MFVKTHIKRISKSILAILVCLCALLVLLPVSPLPTSAAEDADPEYMLKIKNGGGGGDPGIVYTLTVDSEIPSDKTYVFSFEYYIDPAIQSVSADARFYSSGYGRAATKNLVPGRNGMTLEWEYDVNGLFSAGVLMVGVNAKGSDSSMDIYAWNFSLTVKGDETGKNYLEDNGSFTEGKFNSWKPHNNAGYSNSSMVDPFAVLPFDSTLVEPYRDKQYMLKVDTSVGKDGFNKRFIYDTDAPEGTYTLSFDYYIDPTSTGQLMARFYRGNFSNPDPTAVLQTGQHHLTISKTVTKGTGTGAADVAFIVGLEMVNNSVPVYGYIWNFSLTREGDDTNYLSNFENHRFGNWDTGNADKWVKDSGRYEVVEFDEVLVGLDDGKTYMLKMDLDKAASSGQHWSALNVSNYGGTDLTAAEIPGTYTFSYDYFVQYSQDGGKIQNRIYVGGEANENVVTYGELSAGRGTFSRTFTITKEKPTFSLQFSAANSKGGVAYFWNLKLTREGSSDNRLVNKSLRKGTLKGWRYVNQYGIISDDATEYQYFSVLEYDNALTTLYSLGTSVRGGDNPGLRFGFTIANQGIDYANPLNADGTRTSYARGDLSQATVLVDGTPCKVLDMGVLISVHEDKVLAGIDGGATKVGANNLFEVQNGVATFTAVLVKIPETRTGTTVYACPYVQYETEEGVSAYLYGTVLSDSYDSALAKNF